MLQEEKTSVNKKKKIIKLTIFIAIPVVVLIIVFAFVYNGIRIDRISTEIDNGNYSQAEELIDDYQKSNSSNAEPYKLYAELYLAQDNPEKAIEKLEYGLSKVSSGSKDDLQKQIDEIKSKYQITDDNVDDDTKLSDDKENTNNEPTTEDPKAKEEQFKNSCGTIDFKTLSRNPDKYKGNKYKLTGEVIQVQEDSWSDMVELRIDITKETSEYSDYVFWSDTIYATVYIPDGEDNILVDDIITFWGTCDGEFTYETVMGDNITLPKIDIEYYVLGEQ